MKKGNARNALFIEVKLLEERENLETKRRLSIPEHSGISGVGFDHLLVIGYENGRQKCIEISMEDLRTLYKIKFSKTS